MKYDTKLIIEAIDQAIMQLTAAGVNNTNYLRKARLAIAAMENKSST